MAEPNYASGALNLLPIKSRPKSKDGINVGQNYECCPSQKETIWKHSFIGNVEAINERSAVVKIITTHEEDDYLISYYSNKTTIPLKHMKELSS